VAGAGVGTVERRRHLLTRPVAQGLWDFLLYSRYSPIYETMKPNKLNPRYPKFAQVGSSGPVPHVAPPIASTPHPTLYPRRAQFVHDAFWATMSTLISSAFEVGSAPTGVEGGGGVRVSARVILVRRTVAHCARVQVALLWAWANGRIGFPAITGDVWWTHVPTVLWLISMP
jgi:hypothetical protein